MADVFISYSRKDEHIMRQVRAHLQAEGLSVFVDEELPKTTDQAWQDAIEREIERASCIVVLMSPDARLSKWVKRELQYAETHNVVGFAVLARGSAKASIPIQLIGANYIDIRSNKYDAGIVELADAICAHLGVESRTRREQRKEAERQRRPADEPAPPVEAPPAEPKPEPWQQPPPGEKERTGMSWWLRIAIGGVVLPVLVAGALALAGVFGGSETEQEPPTEAAEEKAPTIVPTAQATETSPPTNTPPPTPTPDPAIVAAVAAAGVESNAEWAPYAPHIREFDGVEMALVPAGCFMMGSEDGHSDEQPVHEQCFEEPFWIDVTEVTNTQYGSASDNCLKRSSEDSQPRICVDWFEAAAYCQSRGARLPTEAEWEYAARGPDGLAYPWGNDFVTDNVVYAINSASQTAEVGSRPAGASWVGAHDLSGNVWEWVSTIYDQDHFQYPYDSDDGREADGSSDSSSLRALRGGSWSSNSSDLRGALRFRISPGITSNYNGFRCARSY